jgi:hypothetical protein
MMNELERILDECIDRINRGESVERVLGDYPEHAQKLMPLLQTASQAKSSLPFRVSDEAKRSGRLKLTAVYDNKKSVWQWMSRWQPAWMATVAVIFVALLTVFSLNAVTGPIGVPSGEPLPTGIGTVVVNSSSTTGNFVFLVSDEENAIGDFSSLIVTVQKVTLLNEASQQLIEFTPDIKQFDLVQLPGDVTQVLWQGNIPIGDYSKVYLHVTEIAGLLKTGETISVKLPGGTLQLTKPFQVTKDNMTNFIFDITAIKTGQINNVKYILKPQVSASSTTQTTPITQTTQGTDIREKGKPQK